MPKTFRKMKKTKGVTASEVRSIVKKIDPAALPLYKTIFGGHFKTKIHRYTLTINPAGFASSQAIIAGNGAGAGNIPVVALGSYQISLANADLVASFSALYDQYRIVGAEYRFIPQFNVDQAAGVANYLGEFVTVVDYDDANTPASIQYLRAYENCHVTNTMKEHVRRFIPRTAVAVYGGGGLFTSFGNQSGQWIDIANTSVPHYGIKWGFTGGASQTTVPQYSVEAKYMVEFREVR